MIKNPFRELEIRQSSFHDVMLELIRLKPERTAIVDGVTGRSCTYAELDDHVRRVTSGLRRLGMAKGDIVMIMCPTCFEFPAAVLSVTATGAGAAFVNPNYTVYEIEHALKVTTPSWIITVPSLVGKTAEASRNTNSKIKGTIVISQSPSDSKSSSLPIGRESVVVPFEQLMADDGSWYPYDLQINSSKDVAMVLFSSGTTGLPKGVMLSHFNLVATLSLFGEMFVNDKLHSPEEQGVTAVFLPLYHTYGLLGVCMFALASSFKLILMPKFQPELLLGCIEKYKVTLVPLVPPVVVFLSKYPDISKYDLSSVRRYNSGAAPLSLDSETEFRHISGCGEIRQGYGMTETTLVSIYNAPQFPAKAGSVGVLLPNTYAQVIDPVSKKVLGARERGELCIKGPQIMMGYINNEAATKESIDADGWLHTGDIAYYDEDGYFFIVDRIKELIKFKGLQVAPAELESLLLTHPSVADAAVLGIPDKEAGELPKAFVVRRPGSDVTSDQIKQFVAGKVSSYKHLRGGVEFVDKIPKSEAGKILRRILRQEMLKSKL